jgi:transcriptional regulator with XRE-family HTH domain
MSKKNLLSSQIANRIKTLKDEKNTTNKQLSDAIGIGEAYLSCLLRGEKRFNLVHIEKLCDYFEITPSELFSEHSPVSTDEVNANRSKLFEGGNMLSPESRFAMEKFVMLSTENRLKVTKLIMELDHEEVKRGSREVPRKSTA